MKSRKHSRHVSWKKSTPALSEGDGIDPRYESKSPFDSLREGHDRKTLQLCQQVSQVLDSVLTGESHDEDLRNLCVVSVVPMPHAGRLLVAVESWDDLDLAQLAAVQSKLQHATPWLRSEIAASISRRRTPELVFQIVRSRPMADGKERHE